MEERLTCELRRGEASWVFFGGAFWNMDMSVGREGFRKSITNNTTVIIIVIIDVVTSQAYSSVYLRLIPF